jgi:Holliday junction resolvase RusA-like endonuclease
MINEFILGTPKAQPRVKAFSRGGKAGVFTPKTADSWRKTVEIALKRHAEKNLSGAMMVELNFYFARPKSHFRTGKYSHIMKDDAPKFHMKKPDVDNLAKLPLDVLTKMKYFSDDSQVVNLCVTKGYADIFDEGMRITTEVW